MSDTIPSDRYPTPKGSLRGSRITAVVLTVGVILLGVALAWFAYNKFSVKDVSAETVQYVIVDDSRIDLRFKVTREDPAQPALCIVRARSKDGSETGRREVVVRPSEHGTVELTTEVRTSRPPVMADVYGCGSQIPPYLTAD